MLAMFYIQSLCKALGMQRWNRMKCSYTHEGRKTCFYFVRCCANPRHFLPSDSFCNLPLLGSVSQWEPNLLDFSCSCFDWLPDGLDNGTEALAGDWRTEGRRQEFLLPFVPLVASLAEAVSPPRLQRAPAGQACVVLVTERWPLNPPPPTHPRAQGSCRSLPLLASPVLVWCLPRIINFWTASPYPVWILVSLPPK